MSSEYLRMKSLLEGMGLTFEAGGISNAELSAYAKGIELLREKLEDEENEIFLGAGTVESAVRYADFLRLDTGRFTFSELCDEIIRRMSLPFAKQGWEVFSEAFSLLGSGDYDIDNPDIIFSDFEFEDLKELGKFIEAYIPFTYNTLYDGDGIPFDTWDALACTFNRYDGLNLPFDIIDNLRSDEIEQYIQNR